MASIVSSNGVTAPTKLQLALALAVVKQKPPDTDIQDYILELRQCIKRGKNWSDVIETEKFLDSVSFWQQAYERSEARQSELRDQMHELKQRNEALLIKLRGQDGSLPVNKRKASTTGKDSNSTDVARTRARPSKTTPKTITLKKNDTDDPEEEALCLNRQLHTLEKALQGRQTSSSVANSLAIDAVTLCKCAEQKLIQTISTEQKTSQIKLVKTPDPDAVIKGVAVTFHLVHKTLHKLTSNKNGMQYKAQITYYLVVLFESTMTALALHCTSISKQESKTRKTTTDKTQESTQGDKNAKQKTSSTKNEVASQLADLLCTMALSLDLTRTEDQDVMEGILFLLLTRMGRMLALHVFHDLRLPMGICPGMTFPEGLEAMTDEGIMPNEAEVEAKYLVRLLDRILNVELSQSAAEKLIARKLIADAKDRLQKTLLRAVFGADEDLFREGMRHLQTPPPQVPEDEQAREEKFADWLTQEVWRIVGWDVLRAAFGPT
ncbi:hypothetical protein N7457_004247 [Penicillium paradoxum]|uniref:uncharacterized protein n=1 Tax=Penicillium paradoxum TaxID=176176 RepID=UPI00254920E7|nr:uncharacterized protein N7457_004247 [Penicillium paradoxum]KAJ5782473.1 hypothetical protein N7457_004247 [Penicillium paradoxum]